MTRHVQTITETRCDGRLATACDASHPTRPHTCPAAIITQDGTDHDEALRIARWSTALQDGHQRHYCPAHKAQGVPLNPCPECIAGKHHNCDGLTWDHAADTHGQCPCATAEHVA